MSVHHPMVTRHKQNAIKMFLWWPRGHIKCFQFRPYHGWYVFTSSKSIMRTPDQCVKSVQLFNFENVEFTNCSGVSIVDIEQIHNGWCVLWTCKQIYKINKISSILILWTRTTIKTQKRSNWSHPYVFFVSITNSRGSEFSSYEKDLRKITSHFELLTQKLWQKVFFRVTNSTL